MKGAEAQVFSLFRSTPITSGRLEAFSDGVLAVALTLLALDLKLPAHLEDDAAIWRATLALAPGFVAWLISFAFVLTIWINHHYLFDRVERTDRGLLWLNGFFLLTATLIPFPTALVGEYPGRTAPMALLSGVMTFASASFAFIRLYLLARPHLMKADADPAQTRVQLWRSLTGPALYAAALALSFVRPALATGLQVVALFIFIVGPPNIGANDSNASSR